MMDHNSLEEILQRTKDNIKRLSIPIEEETPLLDNLPTPPKKEYFLDTRDIKAPPKKIKVDFTEPIDGWWPLENVGIRMPDKKYGTAEIRVGKLVRMTTEKAIVIVGGIYSNEQIISVSPNLLIKRNDRYNKTLRGNWQEEFEQAKRDAKIVMQVDKSNKSVIIDFVQVANETATVERFGSDLRIGYDKDKNITYIRVDNIMGTKTLSAFIKTILEAEPKAKEALKSLFAPKSKDESDSKNK